ncbi:MAG: rRNA (uracil1939-C5)-methyltransferase [Acidobacteriaceae bacterium]|jgi:23S rRNA (uracil1939-C5)-methyltransferase|nr:rRNA (uracil1939-C5)-methyltransferase [Acidobacteriaceae bacterium]
MSDELLLLIEKLVYGGDGLTHADGNTVFVPYVLPGEGVRASTKTKKKKLIWTELVEVTAPSTERIAPLCPHFQVCGGCHYQHIPAAAQVRLKIEILRETLSRLGGVQWNAEITAHSGEPYAYRNRAQWAVRSGMPRALGYFLPESSVILPVDTCPILSPRLLETFSLMQEMARGGKLPAGILEIEAFTDSADEKVALNVAFDKFPSPPEQIASLLRAELPRLESLLLLDRKKNRFELTGPGFLTHAVGGFKYQVSHLSFFQVNRFLTEDLLKTVTGAAKGDLALDLYAGVGFFTLPLEQTFERVVSVDANLAATRDLFANAKSAGVDVVSHNEHAEEFLKKTEERPDFVVLDPPRSGLGTAAAAALASLGAAEIVYLSCDPSTLARDLAVLTGSQRSSRGTVVGGTNSGAAEVGGNSAAGLTNRYEITEMAMFDLFPQTFHIETLVRLRKVA